MKRDRESIYLHLNREIGRILEGRISAEVNTDLDGVLWKLADELADKPTADVTGDVCIHGVLKFDGVLWKLADELADKPTADVTGDVCIHGVLKFIPCSRCFNNEPAS